MNYDYSKRGYLLPAGHKNLFEITDCLDAMVLVHAGEENNKFIIELKLPGVKKGEVKVTVEGGWHVRVVRSLPNNLGSREKLIDVPLGYDATGARATCIKGILRIIIPKSRLHF